MAEFQPKKEYGIRAEEYPYHGTKLHGHKSYGALEFNLAAEYPMIERAKREKKKRRTVPHMAAAAMAVATVVLTAAAAAPQSTPAPKPVSQAAYTTLAELPTQPEPTLSPPTQPAAAPAVHVHSYTVQTEQKASCTAPGVLRYVCDCGEEYTESIPMTDHTPEIIPAVEATCQATGLTEGERCSVCGEILVPQEETEKLPHTLKKKWGAYPTCTTPGYTSELSCTVCGEVVQKSKLLPATHHANAVTYPGSDSTCITHGHTESTYCPDCNTWLVPRQERPLTGHRHIVEVPAVAPTCTATGLTAGEKCADCGAILTAQQSVPATGHQHVVEVPGTAPTCTATGLTPGKKCADCGAILSGQEEIPKTDHLHIVEITPVDPTCTEDGHGPGKRCADCGTVMVEPEIIPSEGHVWAPATDAPGYLECTVCHERKLKEPTVDGG